MRKRHIKKTIEYNGLKIYLYDYKMEDPITINSNIEAFDLEDNLLWKAENCSHGRYYDMQIDEANDNIEANDGSSMYYDIELLQGKIIKTYFRK